LPGLITKGGHHHKNDSRLFHLPITNRRHSPAASLALSLSKRAQHQLARRLDLVHAPAGMCWFNAKGGQPSTV